ncbi:transcriptional regulator TACO1-like protein, partial [Paraphysoderma sedebokerense]
FTGHNKWSKIKNGKAVQDAKRALQFTKLAKEIIGAVKAHGTSPTTNVKLAALLTKAKSISMPKSNIESAIAKGSGATKGEATLSEVTYGGVGPLGVSFLIDCMTDKPNRAVKEVKSVLKDFGGSTTNTSYLFTKKGVIAFDKGSSDHNLEQMIDNSIEYGAEEFEETEEGGLEIITPFTSLYKTYSSLLGHSYDIKLAEATYIVPDDQKIKIPKTEVETIESLVDKLEGLEDVVSVSHNADWGDD